MLNGKRIIASVTTAIIILFAVNFTASAKSSKGVCDAGWRPSTREIARLEASLALPKGAQAIGAYSRFYAGSCLGGRRVIRGVLLSSRLARDPRPAVHIVPEAELPDYADGGCSVVTIWASPERPAKGDASCNGVG